MICELCKMKESVSFARTHRVCKDCLKIIKMDNRFRNNLGIEISDNLKLLPITFDRIAYNPLNNLFKNKEIEDVRKELVE